MKAIEKLKLLAERKNWPSRLILMDGEYMGFAFKSVLIKEILPIGSQ